MPRSDFLAVRGTIGGTGGDPLERHCHSFDGAALAVGRGALRSSGRCGVGEALRGSGRGVGDIAGLAVLSVPRGDIRPATRRA